MGLKVATKEQFLEKYSDYDILAIGQTISSDYQTSISIADRFVNEDNFFLLESATQGAGSVARYSFLGVGSLVELNVQDDGQVSVRGQASKFSGQKVKLGPVKSISQVLNDLKVGFCGTSGIGVDTDLFMKSGLLDTFLHIASHLEPTVGKQLKIDFQMVTFL